MQRLLIKVSSTNQLFIMESTFATRVRQFRQHKGLSQQAFAEQCDLTQGNIAQMENGTEPKQSNVSKLTNGFPDLNPDWLLNDIGPMLRDGRTLTAVVDQLPPVLPPAVRQGLPAIPGQANAREVDMVDRLIRNLEEENAKKDGLIKWLQEQNEELLGKSPASAYAAIPEAPRPEISMRPEACRTEAKVLQMWPGQGVSEKDAA